MTVLAVNGHRHFDLLFGKLPGGRFHTYTRLRARLDVFPSSLATQVLRDRDIDKHRWARVDAEWRRRITTCFAPRHK